MEQKIKYLNIRIACDESLHLNFIKNKKIHWMPELEKGIREFFQEYPNLEKENNVCLKIAEK